MKKLLNIIIGLIVLQLTRISFKSLILIFVKRTMLSDVIISIIYMSIMLIIFFIIKKKKKINLEIFPKSFNWKYILFSILIFLLFIATPIITQEYSLINILKLLYNAIITVLFEEIIFRGYIYKEISNINTNGLLGYIISTILFGIWHLGYIDTIIWRTSTLSIDVNIFKIMYWKVITGLIIGIILGFFRYKNKNVYSPMLIHAFINIIGS